MYMLFIHNEDLLIVDGKDYKATCYVRNELNEKRKIDQVVRHMPADGGHGQPYMPRTFPTGKWRVKRPIRTENPEFAPFKIPTNAVQSVGLWSAGPDGYIDPLDRTAIDSFYHLHFAEHSVSTLGCIRLDSKADAIEIATLVRNYIGRGDKVWLEVVTTR